MVRSRAIRLSRRAAASVALSGASGAPFGAAREDHSAIRSRACSSRAAESAGSSESANAPDSSLENYLLFNKLAR